MNLTEYSKKIEDVIADSEYRPLKPEDFLELIGIAAGTEDADAFLKLLVQMEKSGEVAFTKRGKIVSTKTVGLVRGTFRGTSKPFGFVTPEGAENGSKQNDIFVPGHKTMFAIDGDKVLVRIAEKDHPQRRKRDKEYFDKTKFKRLRNGKIVPLRKQEVKSDKGPEGEIVRITERGSAESKIIGVFSVKTEIRGRKQIRHCFVQPDSKKIPYPIFVARNDTLDAAENDKVEVVITQYPSENNDMQGKITRVFGNSEGKQANYNAILAENGIETEFEDDVLKEAEASSKKPISPDGRRNLRDMIIFTIDGADAKDLDDAISLEVTESGYQLGVHIADVSDYVKAGTKLDKCALRRGTSVYFTDQVVPMLPRSLSNGSCSLNGGADRYALSAFITLDKTGEILECEPCESIIRSTVRGVYTEVNDLFDHGEKSEFYEKYKEVFPTLESMHGLYNILKKRSETRGAVELDTDEAKIIVDKNGYPIDIVARVRGDAEKMIEQFMLCANEGVATWLTRLELPCVYRIHETPSPEKLHNFTTFALNLGLDIKPLRAKNLHPSAYSAVLAQSKEKGLGTVLSSIMLRSMMKAKYSTEPKPHFGLAIDLYCHFTSPIRRYPDLSVHRIVKNALHGEIVGKKLKELMSFAEISAAMSSENELRALTAERDIDDLFKVIYMSDKVGEVYDGVVSSVTSFGLFVTLPNTVEGLVPLETLDGKYTFDETSYTLSCGRKAYCLGQSITVKIEAADIASGKISMSLDEKNTTAQIIN